MMDGVQPGGELVMDCMGGGERGTECWGDTPISAVPMDRYQPSNCDGDPGVRQV